MPTVQVRGVHGRMTPGEALKRMLKGTGLAARQVGAESFRLERQAASESLRMDPLAPGADIIVTAGKRSESLLDVPLSLSVLRIAEGAGLARLDGTTQIAARIDGLALTNQGPGRNRPFIRGVADSPFNGPTQSTVSLQIDEVRTTYNAPDPDLRLVDVERVEVLKGPQGPLYGTGALGGVYHIVLRKPDLERMAGFAAVGGSLMNSGGGGVNGEAMLNLPVVRDRLAMRLVGYGGREAGWIDAAAGKDRNDLRMSGVRAALRADLSGGWALDLAGTGQWIDLPDSQYVFARHARARDTSLAELHDNDFRMASATLHGAVGGATLTAAASIVDHEVESVYDATAMAGAFGLSGATLSEDDRHFRLIDSELRLSGGSAQGIAWLAGVSHLEAANRMDDAVRSAAGGPEQTVVAWRQKVHESALFGQLAIPLLPRVRATAGARLFRSGIENERDAVRKTRHKIGFTPSLAIAWKPRSDAMIFARAASAFRPGGLSLTGDTDTDEYDSDHLMTIELGGRLSRGERLNISATLFHTIWRDIQSDTLTDTGLVDVRNAGNGRIEGVDAAFALQWADGWSLDAGAHYQRARLVHAGDDEEQDEDRRLPVVPDLTLRLSLARSFPLGGWQAEVRAAARYTGSARLSFDTDLDRKMGDFATADLSVSARRDGWSLGASFSNLFDSRADSFAFGNPFSIRTMNQYTPLRPRELRLAIARAW